LNLQTYHESDAEQARTADLLRLLPRGRSSILDIGARDGHFSRLLTDYFETVTALDLTQPLWEFPRVFPVAGDVTRLQFADESFDCVFCAEVLEHILELEKACAEIRRVAKHEIVIGVPHNQDTRVCRNTCRSCGRPNPAWGHVNSFFNQKRLAALFPGLKVVATSLVGPKRAATNPVSTWLMDLAGNPWGDYDQEEPCLYCGAPLSRPTQRSLWSRASSKMAVKLNSIQEALTKWLPGDQPGGAWIHMVFSKHK